MTPERVAELVGRWVRFYTRELPPPIARRRIDEIDADLARLLQERAAAALQVAEARGPDEHGHDVARERELLERAAENGSGPLSPEELTAVFGAIVRVSRAAQRRQAEARALGRDA